METPDKHVKPAEDDSQYMSCKGLLAYAGLQRAMGKEPRCLGFKTLLPPNIVITEEDVVPPPPEDAKFVFLGVGVSVYNKEMLAKNRLPLVNGFSQLVVSRKEEDEQRHEEAAAAAAARHDGPDGTNGDAAGGGRRHGHRHRPPPPAPHAAETPGVGIGVAVAAGRGQQQQQGGGAVPATLSQQRSGGGEDGGGPSNRDQMEALMAYAAGRVRKQAEMTKQVAEELTKLTPGKLREAAVVQAKKVREMPTLLLDTSKRMVGAGTKFVRKHLDEQERKK